MTANDVYEFYGENWAEAMRSLGMGRSSYRYWLKVGVVPRTTQYKIEALTKRKLRVG